MIRPAGHRKFESLVRRLAVTNAKLAQLLGKSPSFVSRLRNGHVQKMDRYVAMLEARVGQAPEPFDQVLDDLCHWSAESADLRKMLISLHSIVQEGAPR